MQVSLWVMTQIVTGAEVKDRAKTISKFVNAAKVNLHAMHPPLFSARRCGQCIGSAQKLMLFIFVSFRRKCEH
jgi:hypothetical protein